MKKRSLVAALAMLVVSAIVLTSSTYAWFATSTKANVESVSASVAQTDGSILVSHDNSTWTSNLTSQTIQNAYGFSGDLQPCSYDPVAGKWFTGNITPDSTGARNFEAKQSSTVPANTINYTFYVCAEQACKVTVTPTINANADFVYVLVKTENSGTYLFSETADGYYPITAAGTAVDSEADGIIDSDEAAAGTVKIASAEATSETAKAIEIDFNTLYGKNNSETIDVVMWAEGQDEQCAGSIETALSNSISFAIDIVNESEGN